MNAQPQTIDSSTLTPADVTVMMQENLALKNQYNYDNEWIKFLAKLAENDSIKDIVNFIEATKWTDRQRYKIMAYCRVMLGRGLSTTYITGMNDYRRLYDDFTLTDCNLLLGMTRFDITPEFNLLIDMVHLHFGIESRRSKGGHFVERLGTQRTELVHEELHRDAGGFKQKVAGIFQ